MGSYLNVFTSTNSHTKSTEIVKVEHYVSIGASDTLGVGTLNPSKDGWVPKFASLISAERTINLGQSGSTLHDAIYQQLPKVFDYKPNVVTIWLAVNDFNRQIYDRTMLNRYSTNLNEMLSQLRSKLDKNTRILVGNIPDLSNIHIYASFGIPEPMLTLQIKRWNDSIQQVVHKNQCELVDLYSHRKELSDHPENISSDGFHPSAEGHERLAHIFYQQYLK